MDIDLKSVRGLLLRAYLVVALIFVSFIIWKNVPDTQYMKHNIQNISYFTILFCLLLTALSYACRTIRWINYIRLVECMTSNKRHCLIYLSGFSFTVTPGKLGELIRGVHLSALGVPFRFTFCSFLSERALDVLALCFVGAYFLCQNFDKIFFVLPVLLLLIISSASKILIYANFKLKHKRITYFTKDLEKMWKINLSLNNFLLSVFSWSLQGGILYLILLELGMELDIFLVISVYCLSLLIGAASLIPSGIGVTEIGIIWLLKIINVDGDVAMLAALTTRLLTLWPAMIIGLLCSMGLKSQISHNF